MKSLRFLFLLIGIVTVPSLCEEQAKKMKLYALYTPSHQILYENYFLPSLQDDFDLVVIAEEEQTCEAAKFMTDGWTDTTIKKVKLILQAIIENPGEIFIFSDVDIQFFGPVEAEVRRLAEGYDILLQRNNPKGSFCSGFFVCRANTKTYALWSDVLQYMEDHKEISDQATLNKHLPRDGKNRYDIAWNHLPDSFFGGGIFTGKYWNPGDELIIPKKPLMHHANFTAGVKNKIKQLEYVKEKVQSTH